MVATTEESTEMERIVAALPSCSTYLVIAAKPVKKDGAPAFDAIGSIRGNIEDLLTITTGAALQTPALALFIAALLDVLEANTAMKADLQSRGLLEALKHHLPAA